MYCKRTTTVQRSMVALIESYLIKSLSFEHFRIFVQSKVSEPFRNSHSMTTGSRCPVNIPRTRSLS